MTARFVYWMNVSVDGYIERDPGEDGGGDWMLITEELHREFNSRAQALTMMVQGRSVYEIMDPFWPNARNDSSLPDYLREYGEIWTTKPKVLVSRTRTTADHNTRVIGGDDAITQLAELRADSDGDIGVGGATLATALHRAHLLDELLLFIHPAWLGRGRPLFNDPPPQLTLDLLEHRLFEGGVAMHRYAVA
ncbi:dihydrofolate reductase family protein [Paramicrobacterium fandaimingii]|uniref:dihydrofolate reductase family protein n=1 Tax=Paramicrobacterium fandaimingii TaxID=2708079 RepID=UPI00141DCB93|nr:dihydrofolate reductase family protein [Microbacterium fandaimingii]